MYKESGDLVLTIHMVLGRSRLDYQYEIRRPPLVLIVYLDWKNLVLSILMEYRNPLLNIHLEPSDLGLAAHKRRIHLFLVLDIEQRDLVVTLHNLQGLQISECIERLPTERL